MNIHADFSTQGQFEIPIQGKTYRVSLAKDPSLDIPDLESPDPVDNTWYVYVPGGSKMTWLAIQNLSDKRIKFSYTRGLRWTTLPKGGSWEGVVNVSYFYIKLDENGTDKLFQFTASGV